MDVCDKAEEETWKQKADFKKWVWRKTEREMSVVINLHLEINVSLAIHWSRWRVKAW